MTTQYDLDRELNAFLEEGPEQLPYESFDAVRDRTEQTRQRVVIGLWRTPTMNKFVIAGLGAVAAVAVLLVGMQLIGSGTPLIGTNPTATPQPATPKPTATPAAGLPVGPLVTVDPVSGLQITVTIPSAGWSFDEEYSLLTKGNEVDNQAEAAITLWGDVPGTGFYVYGDPCRWASTTPNTPVTTVDEIATALAAQASRDASEPVDVTVGGYAGKSITLHVPEDANFADCDEGTFGSWGTEAETPGRYQQGPGQIDEIWFLDVDGFIASLDASYRSDTSPALVDELRAIAESATFEQP